MSHTTRLKACMALIGWLLCVAAAQAQSISGNDATIRVQPVLRRVVLYQSGALLQSNFNVTLAQSSADSGGVVELLVPVNSTGTGMEHTYRSELAPVIIESSRCSGAEGDGGVSCDGQRLVTASSAHIVATTFRSIEDVNESATMELNGQIEALDASIRELRDQRSVLVEEKTWTSTFISSMATSAARPSTSAEADTLLTSFKLIGEASSRLAILDSRIRSLDTNLSTTEKRRSLLVQQLMASRRVLRVMVLTVQVERAGLFTVRVQCVLPQAGWNPSYDLSLNIESKQMISAYYANVWQQSSISWNAVELELCTGSIRDDNEQPAELNPWRISFASPSSPGMEPHVGNRRMFTPQQNQPNSMGLGNMASATRGMDQKQRVFGAQQYASQIGGRATEGAAQAQYDEEATASESGSAVNYAATVTESTSGISEVFVLSGVHSVPRDRMQLRILIANLRGAANISTVILPHLRNAAFLRAVVVNESPYAMLQGDAQAFVDGNLIGVVTIPFTGPSARAAINLGVDRSIIVTRRISTLRNSDNVGGYIFTANERVAERQVIISVTNRKKQAVEVLVREAIPVSTDGAIAVTVLEPPLGSTDANKLFSFPGASATRSGNVTVYKAPAAVGWTRHVGGGETVSISFSYSVSWPKDKDVSGID